MENRLLTLTIGHFIIDRLVPFLFGASPYNTDYYMQAPTDPIPEEKQ